VRALQRCHLSRRRRGRDPRWSGAPVAGSRRQRDYRWPGSASTSGWPTSTDRSTTWYRPTSTSRPGRGSGSGCGSRGSSSTGTCWSGWTRRRTRASWPTWSASCPGSRSWRRRWPGWPGRWPTGTRGPSRTCSGWRYRQGMRAPRRRPPHPRTATAHPRPRVGPTIRPEPASCARWPTGGRRARCGPRCPARTGRPGWPSRWRPPCTAGAARWPRSPTPGTWTGWTPRCASASGRTGTSHCPRRSGRPSGTGGSWRYAAGGSARSSVPGRRPSPRSPTWDWSPSGTTATTCTPSRAPRTRTPGRCC
jgi:hypothetical protein